MHTHPTPPDRQAAMRTGGYLFTHTDIQRGREGGREGYNQSRETPRAKRPSHRPTELTHASEPSQPLGHPSAAGLSVDRLRGMVVLRTHRLATEMTTAGTQKRDPPVLTDGSISRRSPPQLRHLRCPHPYRHHRRHRRCRHPAVAAAAILVCRRRMTPPPPTPHEPAEWSPGSGA